MSKRTRKSNSAKQLAALRPSPKPSDGPDGVVAKVVSIGFYPDAIGNLDILTEESGGSRSLVVRKALAYAVANKADFLVKSFGVGEE
jgi:hypothetical protein